MRGCLTLTWVIILLVKIIIIDGVGARVAQIRDRGLGGRGGQAGSWGKYYRVILYFSCWDYKFLGANDMLLFYNLSM